MKQLFPFILIFLTISISSCKKDHSAGPASGGSMPHKVSFKVGFSQKTATFGVTGKTTNSLTDQAIDTSLTNNKIAIIIYAIYDATGKVISIENQLSTDSGFGTYSANLNDGSYTVVIAASVNKYLGIHPGTQLSTDALWYQTPYLQGFFYDTFFQKIPLTISGTDESQNVSLNRITSKIEVIVQDAIPAGTQSMYLSISNIAQRYLIGSESTSLGSVASLNTLVGGFNLTSSQVGTTNYQIDEIALCQTPVGVDVFSSSMPVSSDPTGQKSFLTADKSVSNVPCAPNTVTIISGDMFGGSGGTGGNGFQTTVDTSYNSTPILKSF